MSVPVTEEATQEQETLPALFEHCRSVYGKMEGEALLVIITSEHDREALIWEGYLTKLFSALHLSVPYYTSVTRELKRMGCVRQIRRGGGNAPSQWEVITEPTEELFRSEMNRTASQTAKKHSRLEAVEQQVKDLLRLVLKVNTDNEAIMDILMEKEAKP